MKTDLEYMEMALAEARLAASEGEAPVGAVLVDDEGGVVSRAHDLRERSSDATAHAEVLAIREGGRALGGWRLSGCTLFVTLEPCPMCAGAIAAARIKRLVYGAPSSRSGAVESLMNVPFALGHRLEVRAGVMEDECRKLLRDLFAGRR